MKLVKQQSWDEPRPSTGHTLPPETGFMYACGRGGGARVPLSTGLNCIHNHLSILYNNLSTESQTQWKRKYAGACFCFSFLCFVKVNASAGTNTYKTQCCEARFLLTTSRGRGHITLEANSHWPARVPETQQGSKPAQTKEQGVTSWRTGGHEGLGVHVEGRPWRCEGGSLRGQDQMSIIPIQLSGRTERYGPEIQEGEEKPWRISYFLLF